MTSRERWTVYPLLFLALGASLRDKLTSAVDSRSITCEELTIRAHDDSKRIVLDSAPNHTGRVVLYGTDGRASVALGTDQDGKSGSVLVLGENSSPQVILYSAGGAGAIKTQTNSGVPQIVLQSTEHGGVIKTIDNANQVVITLGHELDQLGLYGIDHKGNRMLALPFMQRPQVAPQPGTKQPEDPAQKSPQPPTNPEPKAPPQPQPAPQQPAQPAEEKPKKAEKPKDAGASPPPNAADPQAK